MPDSTHATEEQKPYHEMDWVEKLVHDYANKNITWPEANEQFGVRENISIGEAMYFDWEMRAVVWTIHDPMGLSQDYFMDWVNGEFDFDNPF